MPKNIIASAYDDGLRDGLHDGKLYGAQAERARIAALLSGGEAEAAASKAIRSVCAAIEVRTRGEGDADPMWHCQQYAEAVCAALAELIETAPATVAPRQHEGPKTDETK